MIKLTAGSAVWPDYPRKRSYRQAASRLLSWATSGHHLPFQTSAYAGRLALELPTGRANLL